MQINLTLGDIRIEIWGVRIRIQRMSVDRKIRRLPLAQFNFYWVAKKLLLIQQSSQLLSTFFSNHTLEH